MLTNLIVAEYVDRFFAELTVWRTWVQDLLVVAEAGLALSKTKPPGARQDLNLYKDAQGGVWKQRGAWVWYRGERSSEEAFAEYKWTKAFVASPGGQVVGHASVVSVHKPDGEWLHFVKRSSDEPAEDWGWEIPESGMPTQTYYDRAVERDRVAIEMADTLLAQRTEIETWLHEAASQLYDRPWEQLVRRFVPQHERADIPDVSVVSLRLQTALDQIAFGRQIRACSR